MTDRKKTFHKDCEKFEINSAKSNCFTKEVFLEDDTLQCLVFDGESNHQFFIIGTEDYPDNTCFSCRTCAGDMVLNRKYTVDQAFNTLAQDHGMVPSFGFLEEETIYPLETGMGRFLVKEIEEIRKIFGQQNVLYSYVDGLEIMDILLLISTEGVPKWLLEAWQLSDNPLLIKLEAVPIADSSYRQHHSPPKASVLKQDSSERGIGQKQLDQLLITERLQSLNCYCVICDDQVYGTSLPSTCYNNLCIFAFRSMKSQDGNQSAELSFYEIRHAEVRKPAPIFREYCPDALWADRAPQIQFDRRPAKQNVWSPFIIPSRNFYEEDEEEELSLLSGSSDRLITDQTTEETIRNEKRKRSATL